MNIENVNFCQPDEKHYCVECCRYIRCELIGKIDNGKQGCTLHPSFINRDTSIKERRPLCETVNCWINLPKEDKQILFETITKYKAGEFRMFKAKKDSGISKNN